MENSNEIIEAAKTLLIATPLIVIYFFGGTS